MPGTSSMRGIKRSGAVVGRLAGCSGVVLPLLQVGGCSATEFRELLINEVTSQFATVVFTAAETVLLNLFNV